jgi:hypothetical protein
VLPAVEATLLPRGDVRIEYHHFPLSARSPTRSAPPRSPSASRTPTRTTRGVLDLPRRALRAQPEWSGWPTRRDASWPSRRRRRVTDGVDACLAEGRHVETVERAYGGVALQLRGTPTVFVGGYQLENFVDLGAYQQAIAYLEAFGMHDGAAD